MTEERPTEIPDVDEPSIEANPSGAIAITLFLAATIIVLWFGMFVLTVIRG